ncbi:MAG: glycosyltransferase family 2 protein [Flavobacterium micromati]|nr:glycosyltransferase family 2 protein [Flavobacterium micromati]
MQNPLVSIITPCYNSEKFIQETIQSVQNQTYQNWEMIIVDDASTDNTVAIIDKIASIDYRIKVNKLNKNSGTGIARNKALDFANGKYIAFLDADDLWKPEKLKTQVNFLQSNNIPFTFSYYECINEEGKPLNIAIEAPKHLSYRQLFFCNYVGNLTGIYDVDYFGKISISSTRKRQDWMLWLTILQKIKVAHIVPQSLAYYRVRQNSISASKFDLVKHNYAVYKTFHELTVVKSIICMIIFLFTQLVVKPRYIKKSI